MMGYGAKQIILMGVIGPPIFHHITKAVLKAGWHFFPDFLRTAIPFLKVPVRFQSIFSYSVLFNLIYTYILTLHRRIRQSSVEKCKVFITQTDCGKIYIKISCDFTHFLLTIFVSSRGKWQPDCTIRHKKIK